MFVCVCVCEYLPVHMCRHVQQQAAYSGVIIIMSTQKWAVLISFPSMPCEQHGGKWICNKFPLRWCADVHTVLGKIIHRNSELARFNILSSWLLCYFKGKYIMCACVCCFSAIFVFNQVSNTLGLTIMHVLISSWTLQLFCQDNE